MKVLFATAAVALLTIPLLVVTALHDTPADDFVLTGLGGASFVLASLASRPSARWSARACPGTGSGRSSA